MGEGGRVEEATESKEEPDGRFQGEGGMTNAIKLKYHCKSCGEEAERLQEGHCSDCIAYFKEFWRIPESLYAVLNPIPEEPK